ncbi:hypothetical protein LSAT2_018900 [Lamellibrachia satsuma]|nr:hypothetical protein LSAT2_018900 [Lamellibrachia satsuma]
MSKQEKEPANAVHLDAILTETIKKQRRHQKMYTNFTINPFSPMNVVTGKPNSFTDAALDAEEEDATMTQLIRMSRQPPTAKYTRPQTSNQEIGWISKPLLEVDKNDIRLHHPRAMTDVTKPKEAEWKLMEQTVNLS